MNTKYYKGGLTEGNKKKLSPKLLYYILAPIILAILMKILFSMTIDKLNTNLSGNLKAPQNNYITTDW